MKNIKVLIDKQYEV